jgi:Ca2+-binding RTX toxin-like protein
MSTLDAREQLFLEYMNRARMDPLGEAARLGLSSLNSGLSAGTISSTPKQVLAPNSKLESSSTAHSSEMITRDYFSHTGHNGSNPGARMASATYGTVGSFGWGENIAWSGSTGSFSITESVIAAQHKSLFLSAGHRVNILNNSFEEAGVGSVAGQYNSYNALMTTQNFAYDTGTDVSITGVHYTDSINNDFYSMGEGDGGRAVRVYKAGVQVGTATTASAGGYGAEIRTTGAVEVVFSGDNLSSARGVFVTAGTSNIKIDLVDSNTIETNVTATLSRSSAHLKMLGVSTINGTGSSGANSMFGNKAANTLDGKGGNDKLYGGSGNDTLIGNTGNDTMQGDAGNDKFFFKAAAFGDDTINSFVDGSDKLQFLSSFVDNINDLTISGNGTNTVTVGIGSDSIVIHSAANFSITSSDLLFV